MYYVHLFWNDEKYKLSNGNYYLDRKSFYKGSYKNHSLPDLGIIKIKVSRENIKVVTDTTNSIEVYLTIKNKKIFFSNKPLIKKINNDNFKEFLKLGYCLNEKTIYENTSLFPCSSLVIINIYEQISIKIKFISYFKNVDYDYTADKRSGQYCYKFKNPENALLFRLWVDGSDAPKKGKSQSKYTVCPNCGHHL